MSSDASTHRRVTLNRVAGSRYSVVNERGGELTIGAGAGPEFTPVELLLVAIGGCTGIDVDLVTSRRAEPESFTVRVEGEKVRDEGGNHVTDIVVTFEVSFPATPGGDEARAILPDIVRKSHERLCAVGRTVELATPIETRIV
ncbi:MAG TPA: OsmC family protein [Streptosporangiaceae bacterium]|nr:OsmC family protein [Streptosporangiaceae bacterium]